MKDAWKAVLPYFVLFAVTFALTWLWRDALWKKRIAEAPTVRDTIIAWRTVELPPTIRVVYGKPDTALVHDTVVVNPECPPFAIDDTLNIAADSCTFQATLHGIANPADYSFSYAIRDARITYPLHYVTAEHFVIQKQPWWVRPALVIGTASTAFALHEKQYYVAAATGGATILFTVWEF